MTDEIVPDGHQDANAPSVLRETVSAAAAGMLREARQVACVDFLRDIDASDDDTEHVIAQMVPKEGGGYVFRHSAAPEVERFPDFGAACAGGDRQTFFTAMTFRRRSVEAFKGRTRANAGRSRAFVLDVEGETGKAGGGYDGRKAALVALASFIEASGARPNFIVSTGGAGFHAWYLLSEPLGVGPWVARARALVVLAEMHGLRIDRQCTVDVVRVMRLPGSLHKSGERARVFGLRESAYLVDEFDRTVGAGPDTGGDVLAGGARRFAGHAVNLDVLAPVRRPCSYVQGARQCGAMRKAVEGRGEGASYPQWTLMLATAKASIEGRDFAHEMSSGHDGYDEVECDKRLDSLTGGPAGCAAWSDVYGLGGPCEACEWRGKVKNPLVELGVVVSPTMPLTDDSPQAAAPNAPEWVVSLNRRYAMVRMGGKVAIADFSTPTTTTRGEAKGLGFMDVQSFCTLMAGNTLPAQYPGDRPKPIAKAWLEHTGRRQYEAAVFAPPPSPRPGAGTLNLWRGFAVTPQVGDVGPWLEVLAAVVPREDERAYVLNWLAWKVQRPGDVPDTILILTGAKGAGKNSLFDPLLVAFGPHGMLADDPEQVAGRFTGHLMDKALVVLDEAVFAGDPRQGDRIKSRVTAKAMTYEAKGVDAVTGINRCAYVMLTNHAHVWQATVDERRAVVLEVGDGLRGRLEFWGRYHAWANGEGAAALLHYLQQHDVRGFNPRAIPKNEALRRQVAQTALRAPAVAWWHRCLSEGAVSWRDGGIERSVSLEEGAATLVDSAGVAKSYDQATSGRGRAVEPWSVAAKRWAVWVGGAHRVRANEGRARLWRYRLHSLAELREAFMRATGVYLDEVGGDTSLESGHCLDLGTAPGQREAA